MDDVTRVNQTLYDELDVVQDILNEERETNIQHFKDIKNAKIKHFEMIESE